jgi:predicted peptidase
MMARIRIARAIKARLTSHTLPIPIAAISSSSGFQRMHSCRTERSAMAYQILEKKFHPDQHTYTIAIPDDLGLEPAPLIVALHFAGHGAPYYGKAILTGLVGPALGELNAIIAAPDCTGSSWTDPQSEVDLLELMDYLQNIHPIDPDKILLTGYSMGGVGTWYLASKHQNLFSGGLIMAGIPPARVLEVDWTIPLYVIHSAADHLMPLDRTEAAVNELQAKGVSLEFVILDGIPHFETHRFQPALHAAISWIKRIWK